MKDEREIRDRINDEVALHTEHLKAALREVRARLNESAGGGRTPQSRASLRKLISSALKEEN